VPLSEYWSSYHWGGLGIKIKHRGLGKVQIVDRMVTELKTLIYLSKNQPSYFNQIVSESEIRDEHAIQKAIKRLLETKQIKLVPNPDGPKNRKYFAVQNYQSAFSPAELENFKQLKKMKTTVPKDIAKKSDSLQVQIIQALFASEIYLPLYLKDDLADPKIKQEIQRLLKRGSRRHGVSFLELKYMIVYSETILSKNYVCKLFKITTEAFEANIKRHPELQLLRKNIREEIKKAKKINAKVIPHYVGDELMIGVVKNSVARKYGL